MSDTETITFTVDLDALSLLSLDDATDTEVEDSPALDQALLISVDDATSDTDVEPEPLSPGGSLKGLYVRSRPTSMDGSIIEFPRSPLALELEPALTHFGLTRVPPAAVYPHTSAHATRLPVGGPMHCVFPAPPTIAPVPVGKRRRYAKSMKGLYTGTGTGTILRHDQASIVPVRIVPRDFEKEERNMEPQPQAVKEKSRGWRTLRKIVPGLFLRPATQHANGVDAQSTSVPMHSTPAPSASTASPSTEGTRTLSIRSIKSFKSLKSKRKAHAGIENIPPVPALPSSPRPRVHSFSGYLVDSELLADEEDETDPEMTAVQLEALLTTLKINERYEGQEVGVAM